MQLWLLPQERLERGAVADLEEFKLRYDVLLGNTRILSLLQEAERRMWDVYSEDLI